MNHWARICAVFLLVAVPVCSAQTERRPRKPDPPKPEPTQMEIFEYVRGKLLALSPGDGINDNLEVDFDPVSSTLSITQPDGRCEIYLDAIDNNSVVWEVVDPSESYHTRESLLRLTLTSLSGKKARTCYDIHHRVDPDLAPNRARLLFSLDKANVVPGFTDKLEKAVKKLVELSGGAPAKSVL
jgi:hypothetical protein